MILERVQVREKKRYNIIVCNIKDGVVKILNHTYRPTTPCTLLGRFAFGTYYRFHHVGVTLEPYVSLWGTERMFDAVKNMIDEDDSEYNSAWQEFIELVGNKASIGCHESKLSNVLNAGDEFIIYQSRGWDWWHRV